MLKLIELLRKSASKLPKTTSEKPLKRLLNWPFKPARLWQQGIETWQPSSGHLVPDALTFTLRQSCIHFFLPILFIYIVGSTVALLFFFFFFHLRLSAAGFQFLQLFSVCGLGVFSLCLCKVPSSALHKQTAVVK